MYPLKQSTAITVALFAFDTNGDGVTGKVDGDWTKRISKDGGAFAALTNSATEVSNGIYKINLAAADLNADVLTLLFSATGADARLITIKTGP